MSLSIFFNEVTASAVDDSFSIESSEMDLLEDAVEIDTCIDDLDHLNFSRAQLISLEAAINTIEQATPSDIHLTQLTLNATVGRLGLSETDAVPSLESSLNSTISTEGIKNIIAEIWKAIVRVVKRVWESIVAFYKKLFGHSKKLNKTNDEMRRRMGGAARLSLKERLVEVERDGEYLAIGGRVPKDGQEVVENLRVMAQQLDVVYKDYAGQLVETGATLTKALNGFDLAKPEKSLGDVVTAANHLKLDATRETFAFKGQTGEKKTSKGVTSITGPELMGGHALLHRYSTQRDKEDNALTRSEVVRTRCFIFEPTVKEGNKIVSAKLKTVTAQQGVEIAQLNSTILNTLTDFDKQSKAIDKTRRELTRAGEALAKKAEGKDDSIPSNVDLYIQEALKYVSTFSEWSSSPMVDMGRHYVKVTRATITYCNKSAKNYE